MKASLSSIVGIVAALVMVAVLSRPAAVAADPPVFEEAECPVGPPNGVPEERMACGYLTVPENRAKANGTQVRLAVAVIKAEQESGLEPILYLSGGPGGPALQGEMYGFGAAPVSDAFADRDIIFYDQRGTGLSTPNLFCDETLDFTLDRLANAWSPDEAARRFDEQRLTCRDRLMSDGVDLAQYSSAISADDIAELIAALGYDQVNLYGVSYGTRLALTVMRDHPEIVSAAVIDSVLPPSVDVGISNARTFTRAQAELYVGCAADAACHAAYPNYEQVSQDLIAQANARPFEVTVTDRDGNALLLYIDGNTIVLGAFVALYDTNLIPLLPFAAHEIANNNIALLTALAQQLVFSFSGIAQGMSTSVNCSEETPFYTEEKLAEALEGVRPEVIAARVGITTEDGLADALALCDTWGTDEPAAVENEPVESDIPTLVFGGQYDPITPPEWGRLAAETLSASYFFEFPATGHGVITDHPPCATSIVNAFLDDPQSPPDGSCAAAIPPPDFQVPETSTPEPAPTPVAPGGVIVAPDAGQGTPHGQRRSTERSLTALGVLALGLLIVLVVRRRAPG